MKKVKWASKMKNRLKLQMKRDNFKNEEFLNEIENAWYYKKRMFRVWINDKKRLVYKINIQTFLAENVIYV